MERSQTKNLRMCNRAQDWQPSLCMAQPGNTASALQRQLPLQAISYLQVKEEEQTVLGTFGISTYVVSHVTGNVGNV